MTIGQPAVLVRWMADREIAICGVLNRISRPPKIKKVFVMISRLGDGAAWFLLMMTLPLPRKMLFFKTAGVVMPSNWMKVPFSLSLTKVLLTTKRSVSGPVAPSAL